MFCIRIRIEANGRARVLICDGFGAQYAFELALPFRPCPDKVPGSVTCANRRQSRWTNTSPSVDLHHICSLRRLLHKRLSSVAFLELMPALALSASHHRKGGTSKFAGVAYKSAGAPAACVSFHIPTSCLVNWRLARWLLLYVGWRRRCLEFSWLISVAIRIRRSTPESRSLI